MKHFLIFIILTPLLSFSQKSGDKKITFIVADTNNLYQQIKIALVKNDFIVKEDGETKQLSTYPREFKKIPGYAIALAEIKGNEVILSGQYGLVKVDDFNYTRTPKSYKPILYMKNGHGWKLLIQVVNSLNGKIISYSK